MEKFVQSFVGKLFLITTFLTLSTACNKSNTSDFADLNVGGSDNNPCAITSKSPSNSAIRVAATANTSNQFVVQTSGSNCTIDYSVNGTPITASEGIAQITSSTFNSGTNTVTVTVTNSYGSESSTWTVTKNTPPVCAAQIPANTTPGVAVGSTLTMRATASDSENDPVTIAWKYNGSTNSILVSDFSTATSSQITFSPASQHGGNQTITANINDGYDTTACTWTVAVTGDCSITTYSPNTAGNNVRVLSSASTQSTFLVNTATAGCPINWSLNGSALSSHDATQIFTSSQFNTGSNILTATVSNATGTASQNWTVVKNAPPTCGTMSPDNSTTSTLSIGQNLNVSITPSDLNSDTITYSWKLNSQTVASNILSTGAAGASANATFSPTTSHVGTNNIQVELNDGYETATCSWPVQILPTCDFAASSPNHAVNQKIASVNLQTRAFSVSPNYPAYCTVDWMLDGSVVGTGSNYNLASNNAALAVGINHTLTARLTNQQGATVTRTWNIVKNSAPTCGSLNPSSGTLILNQGVAQSLQVNINDADSDPVTFSWKLNGSTSSTINLLGSTSSSSSATFTPSNSQIGASIVAAEVTDGYDNATCSWNVTVQGDCSITAISPSVSGNNVRVISLGTTLNSFQVTTATPGCNVNWTLNGSAVGDQSAIQLLNSSQFAVGNNTLTASVTSASGTSSQTWNVTKNTPPACGTLTPSNASTATLGINQAFNMTAAPTDTNTDNMTFSWKLNGASVSNSLISVSTTGNTSSAIFTPTSSQVGANSLSVDVNDGYETTSCAWPVQVLPACDFTSFTPISLTQRIAAVAADTRTFTVTPNYPATCNVEWILDGSSVATGSTYNLLSSNSALSSGLTHTLTARLSNGFGSVVDKTWTVNKNRVPVCSSASPSSGTVTVNQGNYQDFQAGITDADTDAVSFSWALNGSTDATLSPIGSTSSTSTSRFTPNASKVGANVIGVQVNDGYDTVTCSWNVNVQGDCSITAFSPNVSGNNVRIISPNASISSFQVTTATPGCNVNWTINGVAQSDHSAIQLFTSSQFAVGNNTLTASVSNASGTSTQSWNVTKNTAPSCGTMTPTNASTQTIGLGQNINLSLSPTDINSDTLAYSWKLNGSSVAAGILSGSTSGASPAGTFTPTASEVGANSVQVTVDDSYETSTCSWPIQVLPPCAFASSTPDYTQDQRIASVSLQSKTFSVTPNNPATCSVRWLIDGNQVGTGSLYNLVSNAAQIATGSTHTLTAELNNGYGSTVTRSWNIVKNTPPVCASQTPSSSPTITEGNSQTFTANITDTESDSLTFGWVLNGSSSAALTSLGNTATQSSANFSPTISNVGAGIVAVNVSDGYDSVSCSWNVTVNGNCSVTGGSPSNATTTKLASNGTAYMFSVTTSTAGCPVQWKINGFNVTGTEAIKSFNSSDFSPGNNILQAFVSNGGSTTSNSWNVRRNSVPTGTLTPSNVGTQNLSINSSYNYQVNSTDVDGDTLTASWKIDGQTVSTAVLNPTSAGNPFTASFSPTNSYTGNRVLSAIISDGTDSTEYSWTTQVYNNCTVSSYFPSPTQRISVQNNNTVTYGIIPNDSNCLITWKLNGNTVGTGNLYNLASLNGALSASNTLTATLDNGVGTPTTQTWTVVKNNPPSCQAGQSPAATGNEMFYNATLNLSCSAADADNDPVTFAWKLNNAYPELFSNLYASGYNSSSTFNPTIGVLGSSQIVTSSFFDGWDTGTCSWNVKVKDPSAVQIQACSPTQGQVVLLSKYSATPLKYDVKNFTVSATGPDITYRWKEAGSTLSGLTNAQVNVSTTASAANTYNGVTPDYVWASGNRSFIVEVVDKYNNVQSCTWQLKRNSPPSLNTAQAGTNGTGVAVQLDSEVLTSVPSTIRVNYASQLLLTAYGTDTDSDDVNNLSYTWQIDGQTLPVGGNALLTYTIAGDKSFSTATISPNYDINLLGAKTISVVISDGYESTSYTWTLNINMFSSDCNKLYNASITDRGGQVCTLVGQAGVGGDRDPSSDPTTVRMQPFKIIFDGNNIIYTDNNSHSVFYYNRGTSAADDVTRFGKTIEHGKIVAVLGLGAGGIVPDKSSSTDVFKLNTPRGLAYHNGRLYVADYNNHRVVVLQEDGIAKSFVGRASDNNWPGNATAANSTSGATGTTQICYDAYDVKAVTEGPNTYLYMTCRNSIKKADITDYTNVSTYGKTYLVVGKLDTATAGQASSGYENGDPLTEARTTYTRSIDTDGSGNIYWTTYEGQLKVLNMQGSTLTLLPGKTIASTTTIIARDSDNTTGLTAASAGSKLGAVNANANTATKLVIGAPTYIANGQCMPITVQLQDGSSNPAVSGSNNTVTLSATNGAYYTDSGCTSALGSNQVTITAGESSIDTWVKASSTSNVVVSSSSNTLGLTNAPNVTLTGGAVGGTPTIFVISSLTNMHFNNCQRVWFQAVDGSNRPASTISSSYKMRVATLNGGNFYSSTDTTCSGTPVDSVTFNNTATSYQQSFLYYARTTVIPSGKVGTVFGNPNASPNNQASYATGYAGTAGLRSGYGLSVYYSGSNVLGFFLSQDNSYVVSYLNNRDAAGTTASTQTITNVTFGSAGTAAGTYHEYRAIAGLAGTAAFNGDTKIGTNSRLSTQGGLKLDPTMDYLYVGDIGNWRLRKIKLSTGSGQGVVSTEMGLGRARAGWYGDADVAASDATLNGPTDLLIETASNKMFISDAANGRIRQLNMVTGAFSTYAGKGRGDYAMPADDRFAMNFGGPQQMAIIKNATQDFLMFADSSTASVPQAYTGQLTNTTCAIRGINRDPSNTVTIFGQDIMSGNAANIVGDYGLGCGTTAYINFGGDGSTTALGNPVGLVSDGTNMYVSDYANHCILKVDNNNVITNFIGQCGTSGSVDGYGNSNNATNPTMVKYPSQMVMDPSNPNNFFFLESFNQSISKIRYANTGSTGVNFAVLGGNALGKGAYDVKTTSLWTLAPTGTSGSLNGITAYSNKWICVSSGGYTWTSGNAATTWYSSTNGAHGVYCFDRDDAAGNAYRIAGSNFSTNVRGGSSMGLEHELKAGTSVQLYQPHGLSFDSEGNLYVSERGSHVVRMIKRWWP